MQVLYNHYKEYFSTLDGRLRASQIDELYCFHAAFKGAFRLHLISISTGLRAAEEVAAEESSPGKAAAPPFAGGGGCAAGGEGAALEKPLEAGVHAGTYHCGHVVFTGLPHDAVLKVVVEDDPAFAPKGPPPPLRLRSEGGGGGLEEFVRRPAGECGPSGVGQQSRGVKELTEELKNLSVEELRNSSEKYKALLEARELESTLYG